MDILKIALLIGIFLLSNVAHADALTPQPIASEQINYIECTTPASFIKFSEQVYDALPDGELFFYYPSIELKDLEGEINLDHAVASRINNDGVSCLIIYLREINRCVVLDSMSEADYGSSKAFVKTRNAIKGFLRNIKKQANNS
jgi:hypothetical protein